MEIELTTWQRLMCVQIIGGMSGDVALMRKALPVLETLEMTPEEQELVGMVQLPNSNIQWTDTGLRWTLRFERPEHFAFFKEQIEAYRDWPAAKAGEVLDLAAKLDGGGPR